MKQRVQDYWQREPCGTRGFPGEDRARYFAEIERERYEQEPFIPDFAGFAGARGKQVLEVGIGAGTDFVNWVRNGALATGLDLTQAGTALARERLRLEGLDARILVADAERLPFEDSSFDIVYSYGVLHHSPDTEAAVAEVRRVLRPGGSARIMIYHVPSWVGFTLWAVHCAMKLRPWKGPRWAIYNFLESPGTKAYTTREARRLFAGFSQVEIRIRLGSGDLLLMRPSQKYGRLDHRLAWALYPRRVIKLTGEWLGTGMLVSAVK